MKNIFNKNKTFFAFYIVWIFILFGTAMVTQGSSNEFWPFSRYASATDHYFSSNFDFTEAIIYGLSPLIILIVSNLLNENKQD